ncbi:methyltransferase domain-containing protein [Thermococcus sp.]|uniref:methyltransferase domain-containing protein n=1 Tax=Thermococcus sp. TaxID=35749 RepID=UPI0019CCD686|nr:methyltransferase domain-containing protein [Thermococcus sp.]MBC7095438.1 hypothetical protein [Thermococcus sp.]
MTIRDKMLLMSLKFFEYLARKQRKSYNSFWIQSIKYSKVVSSREEYMLKLSRDKNVVHIGFVDYPFTEQRLKTGGLFHLKLKTVAKNTLGVDVDKESIDTYIRITGDSNVLWASVYDLFEYKDLFREYEVFLMPEVIEHLDKPGLALENLYSVMPDNSLLVITTPNALKFNNFILSLAGVEAIHPDHVVLYTPYTLVNLVTRKGFDLVDFLFYIGKNSSSSYAKLFARYPYLSPGLIAVFKRSSE